jgi:hypothetical protein
MRCTSVILDKLKKFEQYRKKGIIKPGECTVIAINICRLSDWDVDGNGISQYPLSIEAVFPVGPIAVPIDPDGRLGQARNSSRYTVPKTSGKGIQTDNFLDPRYAGVSALVQAHQKDMYEKALSLAVIHNPLAAEKLPVGLFAAHKEFVPEHQGDQYQIRDVAAGS